MKADPGELLPRLDHFTVPIDSSESTRVCVDELGVRTPDIELG
jgi:hypothetical protein